MQEPFPLFIQMVGGSVCPSHVHVCRELTSWGLKQHYSKLAGKACFLFFWNQAIILQACRGGALLIRAGGVRRENRPPAPILNPLQSRDLLPFNPKLSAWQVHRLSMSHGDQGFFPVGVIVHLRVDIRFEVVLLSYFGLYPTIASPCPYSPSQRPPPGGCRVVNPLSLSPKRLQALPAGISPGPPLRTESTQLLSWESQPL